MKVLNIHKRIIRRPCAEIVELFQTLASADDRMLATDKWPAMKLDKGLQPGSKGGHGPIRYTVIGYDPERFITFRFDLKGFDGFHRFDITPIDADTTEISHVIDMTTKGAATLQWLLAIRSLHDAYIEDAFDKVENHFTRPPKNSQWSLWVRFLRKAMRGKRK